MSWGWCSGWLDRLGPPATRRVSNQHHVSPSAPQHIPCPASHRPAAVVATVWEKDAIVMTKARPGGPAAVVVSSKLPRFQEQYTLRVALRWVGQCPGAGSCPRGRAMRLNARGMVVGTHCGWLSGAHLSVWCSNSRQLGLLRSLERLGGRSSWAHCIWSHTRCCALAPLSCRPTGGGSGSEGVSLTKSVGEYFHEASLDVAGVAAGDTAWQTLPKGLAQPRPSC